VFYSHRNYTFSRAERRIIEGIAEEAIADARRLLPTLPPHLVVRVTPATNVKTETGETTEEAPPNVVYWRVNPRHSGGVVAVAKRRLRSALLHEWHHLARDAAVPRTSVLDRVVAEGLATAFEHDHGNVVTERATYPPDAKAWVADLSRLPPSVSLEQWLMRHPDRRRWLKAGTFIADEASRASGRSPASLAAVPTAEVMSLACSGNAEC
jgi:hypothetical protein